MPSVSTLVYQLVLTLILPEGVRRLRRDDEHGDKRHDEGEVVEREEREGAPSARR